MRKLVSFMHISLDGYVAGPNGEMDWIIVNEDLFEYSNVQTEISDTALYGRVTFEMMQAYWPTAAEKPNAGKHDIEHSAWYKQVDKIVVSHSMNTNEFSKTTFINNDIEEKIRSLKALPGKDIVMFGSPGTTKFLSSLDLIDEYRLFVNPILLGNGKLFFGENDERKKLVLKESKAFPSGVVMLHYVKSVNREK